MGYEPHYIASFEEDSGLFTYVEPFLLPEKAFPILEDAYCWRGRVKKREGFVLLGRLRRTSGTLVLANTTGAGSYVVADVLASVRATEPNAEIQQGSVILTIDPGGGNQTIYKDNVTPGILTLFSGPFTISAGTINYVTGSISLTFTVAPGAGLTVNITMFYFPALPCMGLPTYEQPSINNEKLIAFDTKYAYDFNGIAFEELPSVAPTTWQGTNSDLFWSTNYWTHGIQDIFWTTNFNKGATPDPIRFYDGLTWTTFAPAINGISFLEQARILLPFKDRLIAMNTFEGANLAASTSFPQRIRWSQNGDPTDQVNGWRDDVIGRGGFLDVPTREVIISAEFVKDVLLVKFERSSWKLIYTGNETLPFNIQKINTELGAESTFSVIPFDRGVLSVGNYGITIDDSVNVTRIDRKIPQIVFDMNNDQDGVKRVYGIRDYVNELVYWAYPNSAENPTFPNKLLVYNYVNETFAVYNDSFTAFGTFQRTSDLTWATLPYDSWEAWIFPWDAGFEQSQFPDVIGGNQQGYVEILQQEVSNEQSLSITAITPHALPTPVDITVPNHNFQTGQWITIINILGIGSPNPTVLNGTNYRCVVTNANTIRLQTLDVTTGLFSDVFLTPGGTYIGGGQIIQINNIGIYTKVFSPFYEQGSQCRLGYVDFLFDKTSDGEVQVDVFIDENSNISMNDSSFPLNDGLLGTNVVNTKPDNITLIPFQANQKKIWHRMFVQSIVQNFQLKISMSDIQMAQNDINSSEIILHAIVFYLNQNARLTQ